MGINCIIIEDEPLAHDRVKGFIEKLSFLSLRCSFDNAVDAINFLKTEEIDLIFLDINLGSFSGIQLLESLSISADVIITTAYDTYALKGYELNVTDYLLKPFSFERFVQAVDKVKMGTTEVTPNVVKDYIFIKTENRLVKVDLDEITYIEGMRDYRRIHTLKERIMTLQTFGELEKLVPPHRICRVHKSYMVALDKIDAIERNRIKIMDTVIPISDTYKTKFTKILNLF